jgi:hypothetical protein
MAYGESPYDKALMDNWARFCDRLKAAGTRVFKDINPPTALQRVDGFRYLTQNLSQAFDLALETKNTKYPAIHAFCSPTRKLGSDNADCVYLQSWIDGESVYKISGMRSTARMWNITVQGPRSDASHPGKRVIHEPFGDTPEANIFGHELKTNWDGSFELFIGGPKQGQNWLPTTKGTRKLFLRQYFDSWDEESAQYRIERVDMITPRPMPTPAEMIDAMKWAADFVYNCTDFWPEGLWDIGDNVDPKALNRFARNIAGQYAGTSPDAIDARRGRLVTMARWGLQPDEALILEFDDSDAFWMLTCEGLFGNSMDYLYRHVSYTPSRTKVDPDKRIRLVVTAKDPGYANWVDNQGYTAGVLTFRNVMVRTMPELRTKVVKAADLARHMHPQSPKVTAQQRSAELHQRFDAIRRRFRI